MLKYIPGQQQALYSGLQTCGSVWHCPVCASKISERRRVEMAEAVKQWEEQGGRVVLITYTVQHYKADNLKRTLKGLKYAREKATEGESWMKFKGRWGIAGTVRAIEVTWGQRNGWHPHIHELLFVEGPINLDKFELELKARWASAVIKSGLREVNQHGVQVSKRQCDMTVAEYLSKFGHERSWGAEREITKAVLKSGRAGSLTPIDLLAGATFQDDQTCAALWLDYAETFKSERQLYWSRGLRKLLGLGKEKTDEEVAEEEEEEAEDLLWLPIEVWKVIIGNDARAEVLAVACAGSAAAVRSYLEGLGCSFA